MLERKFYEASLGGNITSLKELIAEDPLILERVITSFSETPLHIAAMFGHVDFAKELLYHKLELASELDSHGFSPLHLASSRKNLDMVKILLEAEPEVCNLTDRDGRTPLHLAAVKGRIEVMKELINTHPGAIRVISDQGETILHLCVKHNRLEALKLLVESLGSDTSVVSINSVDNDGNTILHLAVAKKHMEMINFLLNKCVGIEVNAMNKGGFTALDVLTQCARDLKDMEIGELLRGAGILRASEVEGNDDTISHVVNYRTKTAGQWKNPPEDEMYDIWLKKKRNTLMVVASLIATMAFQAGVNPPGGVWQENLMINPNDTISWHPHIVGPHIAGTSIMATTDPGFYFDYVIADTIGFLASLSIILLLISGLPYLKRKFLVWILMVIMWVAITSVAYTYIISAYTMTPDAFLKDNVFVVSIHIWIGIMGLILLLHMLPLSLRFLLWLTRKLGIVNNRKNSRISSLKHNLLLYFIWSRKSYSFTIYMCAS